MEEATATGTLLVRVQRRAAYRQAGKDQFRALPMCSAAEHWLGEENGWLPLLKFFHEYDPQLLRKIMLMVFFISDFLI